MRGKGVSSGALEGLIDAALTVLDRPLTRRELAERIARSLRVRVRGYVGGEWGNRSRVPAVAAGGLTFPIVYVLNLVGARGVICSGPSRDNEPTFVRADAWIPRWRDVPRERAEQELLRRYLRAFGPATPADFAYWVGMPLRDAREIWADVAGEIAPVRAGGWRAAVLRDDLPLLEEAVCADPPVRLLPYFDSFVLGHKDREHLVAEQDRRSVYRAQGWIAPVVLVDGRAAGVWRLARAGDPLTIHVTKFASQSRRVTSGILAEARDLGRFLGAPSVTVHLG